jgi:hypothetical protein
MFLLLFLLDDRRIRVRTRIRISDKWIRMRIRGGPKTYLWIPRIQIRNTDANYYLAVTAILPVAGHGEVSGYRAPRGVGALLAGRGGRGRPLALRRGHFVVGLIKVPAFHSASQFCSAFFVQIVAGFCTEAPPPLSLSGNYYSCPFYHEYRHLVCFHCTIWYIS